MKELDNHVRDTLKERVEALETHFKGDVAYFYGPIFPSVEKLFRDFIEQLTNDSSHHKRLVLFLNSPGGSVEIVEKLVEIIRFHYSEVFFVVPDQAMSAGTIFCMSGDKIYMDYTSSLGPIDPQVYNGKDLVPALGYLDQVEHLIQKSAEGTLTEAELIILQNQDLATLSRYEQAKNLTITLLKKWLVKYKFEKWLIHSENNPTKKGKEVTDDEKKARAEEIAKKLSDNRQWHSHGRMIGIETLREILRLQIEDYSNDEGLRKIIRSYNDFLTDYLTQHDYKHFLHSRCYF